MMTVTCGLQIFGLSWTWNQLLSQKSVLPRHVYSDSLFLISDFKTHSDSNILVSSESKKFNISKTELDLVFKICTNKMNNIKSIKILSLRSLNSYTKKKQISVNVFDWHKLSSAALGWWTVVLHIFTAVNNDMFRKVVI